MVFLPLLPFDWFLFFCHLLPRFDDFWSWEQAWSTHRTLPLVPAVWGLSTQNICNFDWRKFLWPKRILKFRYCILHDVISITVISHIDFISNKEFWYVFQLILAQLGVPLCYYLTIYLVECVLEGRLLYNRENDKEYVCLSVTQSSQTIVSFLSCGIPTLQGN